jgi:hypothetical protein
VVEQRPRATTAWFAAKAPSGRSAPHQDASPRGTNPYGMSPQIGYGDWGVPAGDGQAGAQAPAAAQVQSRQTAAGLPQRVPRAAARDGAPVLSAPVPSRSQGGPASGQQPGPRGAFQPTAFQPAGFPQAGFQPTGLPRRRSPEAARSRLAGFQLGGREAIEDRETTGDRETTEEREAD